MNNLSKNLLHFHVRESRYAIGRYLTALCLIVSISSGVLAQNSDMLARQRGPDASTWTAFTNDTGAFSIKFPGNPFLLKKELPAKISGDSVKFLMNFYVYVDSTTNTTYLVRYNDYPAGAFLSDPDKLLAAFENEFAAKGKIIGEPKKITVDGIEGWEIDITYLQGLNGIIRFYHRGNRVYVLLKQVDKFGKVDDAHDPFFESFHLLPFREPAYYTFQPENRNFKIQLPAKPLVTADSALSYTSYLVGETLYLSTDPNSGALYELAASRLSPYYRVANADSIFKKMTAALSEYPDSLAKLDTIVVNGIKGREFITVDDSTKIKKRSRLFIDGENFFLLSGRMDESELFGKASTIFFNSLTLTKPSHSIDLASSKAEKICADVSSQDTLIANRAKGAISYYDFKPDELPFIYNAIKRNYPDDTSFTGVRGKLIKQLATIGNDSTIDVLTGLYPRLGNNDNIKASVLYTLSQLNPKKSYERYFNLLMTDPPLKTTEIYKALNGVTDSLEFAGKNFNNVMSLFKYANYRPNLLNIAAWISESDHQDFKKNVDDHYADLMKYAPTDIASYLKIKDSADNDFSGRVYSYMRLMKQFKHVETTEKLTSQYLQADPKGTYAPDAIVARIYNGLPNKPELVKFFMDSLDTRYDLMKAYYEGKQADKIPALFRRQDQFAQLSLFKYVGADDDDDGNGGTAIDMKLLGTVGKAGEIYYAFKFAVKGNEDKTLVGIAGPFIAGSTKLNFDNYHAYTNYDEVKTNWKAQAEKMIKPLTDISATP